MQKYQFIYKHGLVGKERHRARVVSKGDKSYAQLYTPSKTAQTEYDLKRTYQDEGLPYLGEELVEIKVRLYKSMPNSFSKKKQKDLYLKPCDRKPDNDNVMKLIKDALNGIAYKDDKQVWKESISKVWTNEPDFWVIELMTGSYDSCE